MSPPTSILLIDDDRQLADSMAQWLREQGFTITVGDRMRVAIEELQQGEFDILLTDLRLGADDGLELIAHCREHYPSTGILAITGYGTPHTAVEAVRAGAFDMLTKPLMDDELLLAIERLTSQRRISEENERLRRQLDTRLGMEDVISRDYRMLKIFSVIESVADARASVLITGANGTGKSMIARAIHRRSQRRNGPFIEVACGALPDSLLESELFGHVAGAFTGATGDRKGKFELANGGTLFLDEIGTASPAMQVKLLRVLQELQFEPLGGTQTRSVDVRVILATNEDLAAAVAEGRFRQDLFYRINVVGINVPSLRERPGDIPLLVDHFLCEIVKAGGRQTEGFDDEAMLFLQRYPWPGNIRQLENVVERAVLLSQSSPMTVDDLPPELRLPGLRDPHEDGRSTTAATDTWGAPAIGTARPPMGGGAGQTDRGQLLRDALEAPERQIILQTLRDHHWNRAATAQKLGINRTTLYKKMKRLGLDDPRLQYSIGR